MEAWITQSPRYEITVTGETVALQCYQTYNHDCVYWYQQDQGHGLRLIFYTCDVGILNKEEVPNGYNVSRPSMKDFSLILESVVPSRTSVYLCASSKPDRGWQTQYFGPGTRLLVLGEHGQCGWVFVGSAGAVLNRGHPDLWGWQPADRGG